MHTFRLCCVHCLHILLHCHCLGLLVLYINLIQTCCSSKLDQPKVMTLCSAPLIIMVEFVKLLVWCNGVSDIYKNMFFWLIHSGHYTTGMFCLCSLCRCSIKPHQTKCYRACHICLLLAVWSQVDLLVWLKSREVQVEHVAPQYLAACLSYIYSYVDEAIRIIATSCWTLPSLPKGR